MAKIAFGPGGVAQQQKSFPFLLLRVFIVLAPKVSSLVYLVFPYGHLGMPALFVEKNILSPFVGLGIFLKVS